MKHFLFCSSSFDKKIYKIFETEIKSYYDCIKAVSELNAFLQHNPDAVIWPLFNKADIDELVLMNPELASMLKDIKLEDETICRIRYNGWIYEVNEITVSKSLKGFWKCDTNSGSRLFHPGCVELIGSNAMKIGSC